MRNYRLNDYKKNNVAGKQPLMPYVGPASIDEAITRIEEAEKDIAKGRGYDFEDVIMEARKRNGTYEGAIY